MTDSEESFNLPIRIIFNALKMLEHNERLKSFLDECEKRGFELKADRNLIEYAQSELDALPHIEIAVPGDCRCLTQRR